MLLTGIAKHEADHALAMQIIRDGAGLARAAVTSLHIADEVVLVGDEAGAHVAKAIELLRAAEAELEKAGQTAVKPYLTTAA